MPLLQWQPKKMARRSRKNTAPASMCFFAPVNEHWLQRGARGVATEAASGSAELCLTVACTLVGVVIAVLVSVMHSLIQIIGEQKERSLASVRTSTGPWAAWGLHIAASLCFGMLALACVVLVPHARGSGLPQLIAYLNGVKLSKFTSLEVMMAKFVGITFAMAGGFFCGPEGPIIHIGACVGKLALRALYRLPLLAARCQGGRSMWPFSAFVHFRNDLDERDLVAIGAGAGVAAAFLAPISGTLFVVEEASSHFSLALLWRAFYTGIVALWMSHFCRQWSHTMFATMAGESHGSGGTDGEPAHDGADQFEPREVCAVSNPRPLACHAALLPGCVRSCH